MIAGGGTLGGDGTVKGVVEFGSMAVEDEDEWHKNVGDEEDKDEDAETVDTGVEAMERFLLAVGGNRALASTRSADRLAGRPVQRPRPRRSPCRIRRRRCPPHAHDASPRLAVRMPA